MKVVIADDSTVVTERITEILNEIPDLEVSGRARDAKESLRLVGSLDPEVVILDLEMPGGGALDALREIKAGQREIVIIVLTNSVSNPLRDACVKAGAEFFLDKSYEIDELRTILEQVAKNPRRAHHESVSGREGSPRKAAM